MDGFRKDNADELSAAGKEKIGFDRLGVSGFEICKAERILESINRSFNKNPVLV